MKNLRHCNRASGLALAVLLVLGLLAPNRPVMALTSDADKPIEIEADYFELDDQKGETIYKGNVIMTQGSMRMTGDKLTAYYNEEQGLDKAFLDGNLATFRQRRDGSDEYTEAEARRLEYYPGTETLLLKTRAKVTQGKRMFSGDRIEVDIRNSVVKARGADTRARPGKKGAGKSGGRVKIVIPPKKKKK